MRPRANNNKHSLMRVGDLRIHPTAQKMVNRTKLANITANLDLDKIGTIHIVRYEIDGVTAYWVVDGQHRVLALLAQELDDWQVMTELHSKVKDDAAASYTFRLLNNRGNVPAHDLFLNLVQEGRGDHPTADAAQAVAVWDLVERHHLKIMRNLKEGHVTAVAKLMSVYKLDEGVTLDQTLTLITDVSGRKGDALDGHIIEGIATFLHTYNGKVEMPYLSRRLRRYPGSLPALLGNARGLHRIRLNKSLRGCFQELLVDVYNSGKKKGRLDEE